LKVRQSGLLLPSIRLALSSDVSENRGRGGVCPKDSGTAGTAAANPDGRRGNAERPCGTGPGRWPRRPRPRATSGRRESRTAAVEGVFRLLAEQAADKPPIPDVSLEYSIKPSETSFLSCLTVIPKGRRCSRFSKLCVSFQDHRLRPLGHPSCARLSWLILTDRTPGKTVADIRSVAARRALQIGCGWQGDWFGGDAVFRGLIGSAGGGSLGLRRVAPCGRNPEDAGF